MDKKIYTFQISSHSKGNPEREISKDYRKECFNAELQTAPKTNALNTASLSSFNFASNCYLIKLQGAKPSLS